MRPYGLPRTKDIEYPDLADIRLYGLNSSAGSIVAKCGKRKNSFKNVRSKARSRRIWKKRERSITKSLLRRCNDYPGREYLRSLREAHSTLYG